MSKLTLYFFNLLVASSNLIKATASNYIPRPKSGYVYNNIIAFDELLNALTGGYPNETISSRAGRAAHNTHYWACILCKILNYLEKDHCQRSLEATVSRLSGILNTREL